METLLLIVAAKAAVCVLLADTNPRNGRKFKPLWSRGFDRFCDLMPD